MKNTKHFKHKVPNNYLEKWQNTVDLIAKTLDVPAGLIMRVSAEEIEVLVASETEGNPYEPTEKADLNTGLYCETVMSTRSQLYIKNALEDDDWKNNPDIKLNMIFYYGLPLVWPDGSIFGTFCVLDDKRRSFSKLYQDLLRQFKDMIEADFQLIVKALELKEYQEHLEEVIEKLDDSQKKTKAANQAKSNFLANMSHEIRTPLSAIIGMTSLVMDTELNPEQQHYLNNIKNSSDSLLGLLNDILDFSKIEAGQLLIEKHDFNLLSTLDNVYSMMAFSAKEKGLELTLEKDAPELPSFVKGDELRLRQILVNLIANSVKFTEKGSVKIRVVSEKKEDNWLELHFMVIDTGIGIPADKQETIFSSFSQAESSITRNFGGTGLGLTICKQLLGLMGGEIWLESNVNQGTTFHFTVVLEQSIEKKILQQGDTNTLQIKNLAILLAEDDYINCVIARHVLEKEGHLVVTAQNGLEALEILVSQDFDLILMDVQMPVLDGLTATTIIRASENDSDLSQFTLPSSLPEKLVQQCKGRHIPIVAITANAMDDNKKDCLASGMDNYLTKPFKLAQVREVIANVIL